MPDALRQVALSLGSLVVAFTAWYFSFGINLATRVEARQIAADVVAASPLAAERSMVMEVLLRQNESLKQNEHAVTELQVQVGRLETKLDDVIRRLDHYDRPH